MGCSPSTAVVDGLRGVLVRNCSGYGCKNAAGEPSAAQTEAERALSRRESRAWPTPRAPKVCVCVCVCVCSERGSV